MKSLLQKIAPLLILSGIAVPLEGAERGQNVSPSAYELTEVLGLPITNAMVTSWVFSLIIILIFRHYASKPKLVPPLGQAVIENMVTGIRDIVVPIIGPQMVKPAFPLLMGLFTFILIQNWAGLLPGVGTFGFYDKNGNLDYWFRPGNADLNMTIALALVAFFSWLYLILKYAGPKIIAYDLFGNKADKSEVPAIIYYSLFIIFFGVGLIEIISILFRPVSLSFRLFGNMFGGENLLMKMTGLIGYIVPVPFYFLEILIGLVQALVFTLLVAVYIGLICNHEGEEHAH